MQGYLEVRKGVTERSSSLCSCLSQSFRVSEAYWDSVLVPEDSSILTMVSVIIVEARYVSD